MAEYLLENIHILKYTESSTDKIFLYDLTNAINAAEFTEKEKEVLSRLYLYEPEPPKRDRVDKNGFTNGRPLGGTTQAVIAEQLGVSTWTVSKLKDSVITKIAAALGEEYVIP